MAFEGVVFRNRNLVFVVSFNKLELKKSVQAVPTERWVTNLQVTLVSLPAVHDTLLACSKYPTALAV